MLIRLTPGTPGESGTSRPSQPVRTAGSLADPCLAAPSSLIQSQNVLMPVFIHRISGFLVFHGRESRIVG